MTLPDWVWALGAQGAARGAVSKKRRHEAPLYTHRPPALPVAASPPLPRRPHWRSRPQVHAPIRCLRQAQCLPLPHTCLPHLPTFPHRLYTSPHIHGAAPPCLSHPTAPPGLRQPHPAAPSAPRPHPKPPPSDAQPHRAAPPHAVPRVTRRSIRSDSPCPPSPPPPPPF